MRLLNQLIEVAPEVAADIRFKPTNAIRQEGRIYFRSSGVVLEKWDRHTYFVFVPGEDNAVIETSNSTLAICAALMLIH